MRLSTVLELPINYFWTEKILLLSQRPFSLPERPLQQLKPKVFDFKGFRIPVLKETSFRWSEIKKPGVSQASVAAEREGLCSLRCAFPFCSPQGPCKQFEAHGITAFGLFQHKSLQEQAPDGLARKKPSALR